MITVMFSNPPPQMDRRNALNYFSELPVSLVLFALILVDVIERIRPFKLCGQCESLCVVLKVDAALCAINLNRRTHCQLTARTHQNQR